MAQRKTPTNRPARVVVEAQVVVPESAKRLAPPELGESELSICEEREWRETLTQNLCDELVGAAKVGGFKRSTALACGVRPELLEWWLNEGMRSDAPPLMRQLSARFLSVQEGSNLKLVEVIQRAALFGDWQAAMSLLEHRDPLWRKGDKNVEADNAPPERSLQDRYQILVESFRNPQGDMRRAMIEAGLPIPEQPALTDGEPES